MSLLGRRPMSQSEQANAHAIQDATPRVSYLMPTATGLRKAIIDAIEPFREFLRDEGVHDYGAQSQGQDAAIRMRARFVSDYAVVDTTASLYRPLTKSGDPRIWFYGLPEYADANDLIAVVWFDGILHVLNVSRSRLAADLADGRASQAVQFIEAVRVADARDALDLLTLIREIAARGPTPAVGSGDTAIGRTLESALGVVINSYRRPDWRGIELKAYRARRQNRKTLFAQVPDWSRSACKSSAEILQRFGYWRDHETLKLYVTVSVMEYNSRGLRLALNARDDTLDEVSSDPASPDVAVWPLSGLRARLREKHRETFWVGGESVMLSGREHFVFRTIEHTRQPVIAQLEPLIATGNVTLDHLIKRVLGRVVEKGPLFRADSHGWSTLFPEPRRYRLP